MLRTLVALSIGAWLTFQASGAGADPAAAEALFREARVLLARGDLEAACAKFEASQELEATSGTLLNLGDCRLKQGKNATAWAHFVAAERLAQTERRFEHAQEARRRVAELEPRLSTLTLLVERAPPGLELRRGGKLVLPGSWGTRVPVDPGRVVVQANAPGYEAVHFELTVATADHQVVRVPPLVQLGSPQSTSASSAGRAGEAQPATASSPSATPWIIAGVGAAALVTGGVFGALALASNDKALDQCGNSTRNCPTEAIDTAARRDREALASTIGIGVGVLGLGVAALWWLRSDAPRSETAWSCDGTLTRDGVVVRMGAGF